MLDELHAHKVRVLSSQWDSYVRAVGLVRTFASDIPAPASKPDFEAIANTQIANLKKRLRVVERDILPVTEQQLREAVRRGMRRLPPCTERGEEIRDAILWLQVLQLAQDHADTTIAFISANSRQFAEKDGALLPVLAREVLKGRVAYYTSLDAFAKQHATAIEFITAEWIEERIAADAVCSAAEDRMIDLARASVSWSRYGDYPDIGTYWVEFDDFYVYEMEDGTLRVLVIWYRE